MLNLAIAKKELKNGYHHFVVFDGDKVKKCNTLFKGKLNSRSQLLKLCNTLLDMGMRYKTARDCFNSYKWIFEE
jgi:hypothetical protein